MCPSLSSTTVGVVSLSTKTGISVLVKSLILLLHEGKDKGTVLVLLRNFPGVTPIHSLKKKSIADNLLA